MRVRLSFDPSIFPLRCWYEIPVDVSQTSFHHTRIQDLISTLIQDFDIKYESERVYLEIDNFELLPVGKIAGLIKENDLLCVRLRESKDFPIIPIKRELSPEELKDKPEISPAKKSPKKTKSSKKSSKVEDEVTIKRKNKRAEESGTPKKSESRKRRKIEETEKSSKKKKEKGIKKVIEKVKNTLKKVKSSGTKSTASKDKESQPKDSSSAPVAHTFNPELSILEPPVEKVNSITHVMNDTPVGNLTSTLNLLTSNPASLTNVLLDGKTPTQARNARKRKKRQLEKLERRLSNRDQAENVDDSNSTTLSTNKEPEFYENPSASLVKNKRKGFLKDMLNLPREHVRFDEPTNSIAAQNIDSNLTQSTPTSQPPHPSMTSVSAEPKPLPSPKIYHSTVELGFDPKQPNRKNRKKQNKTNMENHGVISPPNDQAFQYNAPSAQDTQPIPPASVPAPVHLHQISADQPIMTATPDDGPRNYNLYEPLLNPKTGDLIAYKVLEMTASYTPEISDYKEATVISFDYSTNTITLKLSPNALKVNQGDWDGISTRKFELQPESDDEYVVEGQLPLEEINMDFSLLIEPKKLPKN
ncbi:hypothetical protein K7432_002848 [Basidiobolus ranarum]|uniref:Coilin tudor domain-containing protein n=1 Tax=Basidiobolus ranarum TaxID=34480 RepID=A0ABR2X0U6_9FUNG